jgi:hypothetical protein
MIILSWNINDYIKIVRNSWINDIKKDDNMIRNENKSRFEQLYHTICQINPYILCLQEVSTYFIDFLESYDYQLIGKVLTHGGWCCTLIKDNKEYKVIKEYFQTGHLIELKDFKLINCHLTPYSCNEKIRNDMLSKMLYDVRGVNDLIIGDLNTDKEFVNLADMIDIGKKKNIHTWYESYFNTSSKKSSRLDRVICRKIYDLEVFNMNQMLSDHLPIWIII